MPIRGSPNGANHLRPQAGRDRLEQVVAINRNAWSQSIGTAGRNHPVRAVLDFRATEQDAITPKSFTDNRRHRRLCGEPKTTANSSQDGQARRCGSADCDR